MSHSYRGRFAPSPTGPLHFGSLVCALASYLDAKKHKGTWLIRIEDVDQTRCKPLFTEQIIATLHSYLLFSDEEILTQYSRSPIYESFLSELKDKNVLFPCNCTRQQLSQFQGLHPKPCDSTQQKPHSWRLEASHAIYQIEDPIQGTLIFKGDLKNNSTVLKRKDDFFSYQLAVVVDDHLQEITHLVRGADLIETTAQQLHLYHLLNWTPPHITHIPLITNSKGDKISKQNHAKAVKNGDLATLIRALHYLGIDISSATTISDALEDAIEKWNPAILKGIRHLTLEEQDSDFIE
ncbi:tRNA glutamyl-Q(34) synthetase GluQRS [Marinomonas sp. C2222]|uniref:tRNA glutamyl-Q(34) synthetase GluQRS n=1 Tax=Marinomonas sargassi TaxID=2984494 RepID=A0ABT2YW36_9GAMM|nr:tRNA glutamyl-Q(34) synthetase GluQRS [Marinomonas sargassi]MCV2404107.1 tRNA glutamyl-Q(34) synthetase GluQRS [Marinomonas sargassi]